MHAVSSPSLLGPSTAPEDEGYSYPDNHTRIGQRYGQFRSIPTGPVTYPACCPDCSKIQHLPLCLHATNYNKKHAGSSVDEEVLRFIKENSLCECQSCRVTKLVKEHNLCDCRNCSTKEVDNERKELKGAIASDKAYSRSIHTSDHNTEDNETTASVSTAHCKYCNDGEQDSKEERTVDEDDDGTSSPWAPYSQDIHMSTNDTDSEDIINIYSEDPTGRSLSYIDDTLPHSKDPTENNSRKYTCQHFWVNDCLYRLSGKVPWGQRK